MKAGEVASEVTVGVILEATSTKALYFPPSAFSKSPNPPSQILLWNKAEKKKCSVVVSVSRAGENTPAGVNPILFSTLGGRGSANLVCQYRAATTMDKLRFIPGTALTGAVALVSFIASCLAAYQAFSGDITTATSRSLVGFAAAMLLTNSLLALMNLISQWQKLGSG
jgi:hypothetical protein